MFNGYIKLHRKSLENIIIYKDTDYFSVWMYLLLHATHKKIDTIFNGRKILLLPGQLITGRRSIANFHRLHESKVQRILKCFEIEHQIKQQTNNRNRLITIVNWIKYQKDEQQNEHLVNNKRTPSEHLVNTNNNVKNVKNVKNDKNKSITTRLEKPTIVVTKKVSKSGFLWEIYKQTHKSKYGVEPLRNQSINVQLCRLIDSVGAEWAGPLIQYYYKRPDSWVEKNGHPLGWLLKSYQKYWTEMQSKRPVYASAESEEFDKKIKEVVADEAHDEWFRKKMEKEKETKLLEKREK